MSTSLMSSSWSRLILFTIFMVAVDTPLTCEVRSAPMIGKRLPVIRQSGSPSNGLLALIAFSSLLVLESVDPAEEDELGALIE